MHSHTHPKVTVGMCMYNAASYLREAIASILHQSYTNFELLIVDDASTDDSVAIAQSFHDKRIRIIQAKQHDYIAALNIILKEAQGIYLARMDADDKMVHYRLAAQVGFLEKNPHVAVLGGGIQKFGGADDCIMPPSHVGLTEMINGCCIAHPTVMLRLSVIRQHDLSYNPAFRYAEDYHLWIEMLKRGLQLRNLPTVLLHYRVTEHQISSKHSKLQQTLTQQLRQEAARHLTTCVNDASTAKEFPAPSKNLLTIVIPFLNEGEEVGRTVRSIRNTAGNAVEIIVINDASDDTYNYAHDLAPYHVHYVVNSYRIGAAASKQKGVELVRTPYFLLLDAHMRCFTPQWSRILIAHLQENSNRLLCCQTRSLRKKDGRLLGCDDIVCTHGAYVTFDYQEYLPGIRWNDQKRDNALPNNQIACILGAAYASSTRYWHHIKGLTGLIHYGGEETYLSLKAWLEGGGCTLLPDITFGHIYRDAPPYRIVTAQMYYNHFVIAQTLFPMSLRCWAESIAFHLNSSLYADIKFWLSQHSRLLNALKNDYSRTFSPHFSRVLHINNIPTLQQISLAKAERLRLKDILDYNLRHISQDTPGLMNGTMGLLIALCTYEAVIGDSPYADTAQQVFQKLCTQITPQEELSVSFAQGWCGIGWGLIYLMQHHLADVDFETELRIIDRRVSERSPLRMRDYDFNTGIGGILCYVVQRYIHCIGKNLPIPFDTYYLNELTAQAKLCLQQDIDFRTHSYALQLLQLDREKEAHSIQPTWKDIIDLPNFLSQDQEYWTKGLSGSLGYLLRVLDILEANKAIPLSF